MTEKRESESLVKQGLKKSIKCKPDEYKIIFHSKSILFSQAISDYLYEELKVQKTTTLLIDLSEEEVDEIFNDIVCKRSYQLLRNPTKQTKFELRRLNEVTKQKRSQFYKTPGIYSVSIQILIMDLIRFQKIISLNSINRIIIRISQKIKTYLNYHGWIFTLLKKQKKNCSVILLCRQVQYYHEFQALQGIYRTFFCSKLVIWPFGRSQIHKSIEKTTSKINEHKHYLDMTQQMKKNEQILKKLLEMVQRQYNRFRTTKINALQVLMKESIGQQLQEHSVERFQTSDFRNIKFLMNCVQNYDSIHLMQFILTLRNNDTQKSIWNSSNSIVSELFEEIQKNCKNRIFTIQKLSEHQKSIEIDLAELIRNFHYERDQDQIANKYDQWKGIYQLDYKIESSSQRNHKVIETYEIIDKILEEIYEKQAKINSEKEKLKSDNLEAQILRDIENNDDILQRLLVNCPNERAKWYLHKQLFSKVNKSHYIESLRSVHHFLAIERQLRISNIKSIYNKIKIKKTVQKMEIESNFNEMNIGIKKDEPILQKQKSMDQIQKQIQQRQSLEISQSKSQSSSQMLEAIDSQMQIRLQQLYKNEQKSICQSQQFYPNKYQSENQSFLSQISQIRHSTQNLNTEKESQSKVLKKSKKPFKQVIKENIIILQECLYKELTLLFQILSRYQNKVFTDEQIRMNTSNTKKSTKESLFGKCNSEKLQNNLDSQLKKNNEAENKEDSLRDMMKEQSLAFENLFQQQISRVNFHFIDKSSLSVVPNYTEDSQISFYSKLNPQKKVLIVSLFSPKPPTISTSASDRVTEFNRAMKLINPHRVIFYSPHSWQIRNLYLTYSEGMLLNLKQINVLAFTNSFQVASAQHQIKTQDEAFWKISQNRMKLSEYKENPQMRIKELNMNDKYEKTVDFINYAIKNDPRAQEKPHIYRIGLNQRRVIVDTREFKSSLPCYLFFCGFTVIPIQLQTADYILSDQIGIQKKSVVTRDLQMSLKSFRVDKQIKRLCQKFQKPYLLIECEETDDFKKENFYEKGLPTTKGGKDSYKVFVRQRLAELLKKFPKLRIIWSDSVNRTCEFFKFLKKDQAEPEIGKYMKNESDQNEKTKLLDSSDEEFQKQKEEVKVEE